MGTENKNEFLDQLSDYQYGFKDSANFVYRSKQGLDEEVVREISLRKGEPEWMLNFRLKALAHFNQAADAKLGC